MKFLSKIALLAFLLITIGCNKSEDEEPTEIPTGESLILVGNEGGFGAVNASLTVIAQNESTVSQNIYADANDDAILGDVLNSMGEFGNELFLVINNSEKIEVINSSDFTRSKTIFIDGSSPRYISFVSAGLAYVSDLFDTGLHVVNPTSGSYDSFLNLSNSVEHMLVIDNELWGGESLDQEFNPGDEIIIVNTNSNQETENIQLTAGVNKLVRDVNGKVWVLCSGNGNSTPIVPAFLYRINPTTKEIEASVELPELTGYSPVGIASSADGQSIYYVMQGDVYRMEISASALPVEPFIEPGLTTLYSLHCDPNTGQIALTDAKDYTQNGSLHVYNSNGVETGSYETSIVPNAVHWMDN